MVRSIIISRVFDHASEGGFRIEPGMTVKCVIMVRSLIKVNPMRRYVTAFVMILLAVITAGWFTTGYLSNLGKMDVIKDASATLSAISFHLDNEMKKAKGAVEALAGSPWVFPVLLSRNHQNIQHANSVLDRYKSAINASVTYLIDVHGTTVASSNRNARDSFIGKSYRFRSYFTEAMAGKVGRYFAMGVTSGKKGFYASSPVKDSSGRIVGVAVIKKDLDEIEEALKPYSYCFFVNEDGVIFLSGQAAFSLKTLWPLEGARKNALIASRQFGTGPFKAVLSTRPENGATVVINGEKLLVTREALDEDGWSLIYLAPTNRMTIFKLVGVISTVFLCVLIGGFILLLSVKERSTLSIRRGAELLKEEKNKAQKYLEIAGVMMLVIDKNRKVTLINKKGCDILGYDENEILGKNWFDHFLPEKARDSAKVLFERLIRGEIEPYKHVEDSVLTRSGEERFIVWHNTLLRDAEGNITGTLSSGQDITERKKWEEVIEKMAYHDDLTGLPNRRLFNDRLAVALGNAKRFRRKLSIMILDMDNFKEVNDTLGHDVGDLLLVKVGNLLSGTLRASDTIARIGGDEFILLISEIADEKDAIEAAERIIRTFREPVACDGHTISVTTSIGIAIYPDHGDNVEILVKHADTAMYLAKEQGRNRYCFYTPIRTS